MGILLQVLDAEKSYGSLAVLDRASATIQDGQKIGLIGRNGAGKSTLCRVLVGDEELDAGEVRKAANLRIGYLRQHDPFLPGETVLEFLMRDSEQPDWRCGEVAGRFELKHERLSGKIASLSGGWQTRVKLAALLLHDPQLLILDEPTNFLDLRTQLLLELFLKKLRSACLVVSHDRAFLRATCTETLELRQGKLTAFPGSVDAYFTHSEEQRLHDERVNATLEAKKRQLQDFIDRNRARATTASRAQSKVKQLARLEDQGREIAAPEAVARIRLPEVEPRKGMALSASGLRIGYPDRVVAEGIELEVKHGERVVVLGDNGQGKTTFLRTLTGSLPVLGGKLRWGAGCELGVYAQHVYQGLAEEGTVYRYLERRAPASLGQAQLRAIAGSFLFRKDEVDKPISVLSGGERARLCLAGLVVQRFPVLVLDEPGNHLDVDTVESFAEALCAFPGTVVFTSHDRTFVERVATTVVEVRDGRVVGFPGSYEDYVYRVQKELEEGQRDDAAAAAPRAGGGKGDGGKGGGGAKGGKGSAPPKPKLDGKRRYELRKQSASLERKLTKANEQKKRVLDLLRVEGDPKRALELQSELDDLDAEIGRIEPEWLALEEQLEEG